MNLKEFISVSDFCLGHDISYGLMVDLKEYGLVEIIEKRDTWYIATEELPKAEKILRLHSELDINLEGIEVITQLLQRLEEMQNEMTRLKNRLRLYE